ncbi:Multidrug transporter TPO1_2 like protein [Verticillium longisporum]|uniref:Multidrug transporter TPO1_2 like protein n=1 Tax=Verticillium longisporum TaxID=100787 RepID=A0A8I2Z479_VERLO|nr:Multidrug transporter TPO1_2 like protein [Verticillium longisporum]
MDEVDRELSNAARAASPGRYQSRGSHEIERVLSASTTSSTSTSSSREPYRRNTGISRVSTQNDLERHPTALSRIATQRSQHSNTVGRSIKSRESRKPLPNFGAGKPYPPHLPDQEEYVVEFDGPSDPLHAQNWPMKKKMITAVMLAYTTLTSAFGSSIFSAATAPISVQYNVSNEVGILGVSFYVLGFATGPTLWAPLSELKGRRLPLVLSMFGFSLFSIAAATGKDIQTILICRFFSGFFGACPLAVVAAVFSDIKASELRRRTRNWGIHAKQEEIEVDLRELITKNFTRPMRLLFFEPIVTLLSIYMAFIYGILYLFLTAYPFVFRGVHGFNAGESGLAFFGMVTGQLIAGTVVLLQQPWYLRKLKANNGVPVPEWRLPSVIVGGVFFAAGIFWFGWSGYRRDIHWIVPALSGLFTGFGLMSIFLQSLNYLVDSYLMFAASAIAGNTFLRSLCGAGFPLFATQMFEGMGIEWASTLLGCIAALLAPIPLIFWLYGHKIRAKSAYAPTFQAQAEEPVEPEDLPGAVPTQSQTAVNGANGVNGPHEEEKQEDLAARANAPATNGDRSNAV